MDLRRLCVELIVADACLMSCLCSMSSKMSCAGAEKVAIPMVSKI